MVSAGGYQFLAQHPKPTLREVFLACEQGKVSGIACCEDMNKVTDWPHMLEQCGQVSPKNHDPFGFRVKEENDWDALQAQQEKELNK